MHSGRYNDTFFISNFFGAVIEIRYCQNVQRISSECLSQHFSLEFVVCSGVGLKPGEVPLQVGEGIWVAVCEIASVVVMLHFDCESQSKVVKRLVSLHMVLVVAYVLATSHPPFAVAIGIDL